MKKLTMVASMVLVSLVAKSNAHAFDGWRNGAECQPATAADAADLVYSQYGVQNMSTTTARNVICPIPTVLEGDVTFGFRAYDRNNLFVGGNINNISCNIVSLTLDGAIDTSANLATSGGGPGAGAQEAELTIFEMPAHWMWQFQCSIPKVNTPGHFSHLTFYWLQNAF